MNVHYLNNSFSSLRRSAILSTYVWPSLIDFNANKMTASGLKITIPSISWDIVLFSIYTYNCTIMHSSRMCTTRSLAYGVQPLPQTETTSWRETPPGQRPLNRDPHCTETPHTETPQDRAPGQKIPLTWQPLDRDLPDRDPLGQKPLWTETPLDRDPWTETPGHRSPGQRPPPRQRPPGQRPPGQKTPGQRPTKDRDPLDRPPWRETSWMQTSPLGRDPPHPAGRSLNLFWRERSNKSCHTEELLPAAILVTTRVILMKIGLNVLNIHA